MSKEKKDKSPEEIVNGQVKGISEEIRAEQLKRLRAGKKISIAVFGNPIRIGTTAALAQILAKDPSICPVVMSPQKLKNEKETFNSILFPDKNSHAKGSIAKMIADESNKMSLKIHRLNRDMGSSPPINLKKLRDMNLSNDLKELILSSSNERMNNEEYEEFKERRKLKRLLEKYKDRI